jgi:hypothetical protein
MRDRLLAAGFVDVETSMFEAPVQLSSVEETRDYFENVILGTHLARITDAELRSAFLERMTEQSAADDPAFRQAQRIAVRGAVEGAVDGPRGLYGCRLRLRWV